MSHHFTFESRTAAGRILSRRIQDYAGRGNTVVLAVTPGGIPVGFEVAQTLKADMDILVIHKLEVPGQPQLAMGVVVSGDARYLNKEVIRHINVSRNQFDQIFNSAIVELHRRERAYRSELEPIEVAGRDVILVDDGIHSIDILRWTVLALRARQPKTIILAMPVTSDNIVDQLGNAVDEIECVYTPHEFHNAREFYASFDDVSEQAAQDLLRQAASSRLGRLS